MTELDPHWLSRVNAIGATQARYLWSLLILMLFYAALQLETVSLPATPVKVPVVDLEISRIVVLSSGSGVLSLIVMAIAGSIYRHRRGAGRSLVASRHLARSRRLGPFDP